MGFGAVPAVSGLYKSDADEEMMTMMMTLLSVMVMVVRVTMARMAVVMTSTMAVMGLEAHWTNSEELCEEEEDQEQKEEY